MINHEMSAHTYSDDRPGDDPLTALRVIRRGTTVVTVTLLALGIIGLGISLIVADMQMWHLGLTVLALGAVSSVTAVGAYIGELVVRQQRADHRCSDAQHEYLSHRMDALEAGDRAIAGAICSMPDGALDEVAVRRSRIN
jgi:hypothetical protein